MRISDWSSDVCSSDLDVSKNGRTILFVSHKMDALRRLCERAILLERGRVIEQGSTEQVVAKYLVASSSHGELADLGAAPDKPMRLRWVQLLDNERSEEHTSEIQSLMRISYAVFCLTKKKTYRTTNNKKTT